MSNLKKITHTQKIYKNTITNQKSLLETHAKKNGGGIQSLTLKIGIKSQKKKKSRGDLQKPKIINKMAIRKCIFQYNYKWTKSSKQNT